jgi:hypothetical protein
MNKKKTSGSPKPSKVVRKLKLSKETVSPLTSEIAEASCTMRATGCPIHTC